MIQTPHKCLKRGQNGHSVSGFQQYHCRNCGGLDPEPLGYPEVEKEQVPGRGSKRAISRIFSVSRNTLNRWLGKRQLKRDEKPS